MVGGLQGEEWKFIQKYMKKRSKRVGAQISQFSCRFRTLHGDLRKSRKLISQLRIHFRKLKSTFARWDPSLQFSKSTSNAGLHCDYTAAIHFKFRTLKFQFCKVRNCPSAWCSCLPKAISSSFQLQIVHSLKRWILDFQSFKILYRM